MDEQGATGLALNLSVVNSNSFFVLLSDKAWLDAVNAERKKEQVDVVSYETFEVIMDRLEKEWFDLVCYCHFSSCLC